VRTFLCDNSPVWAFVRVSIYQCEHLSVWAIIRVSIHPCEHISVWAYIRVCIYRCGFFSCEHLWQWGFVCAQLSCGLSSCAHLSGHRFLAGVRGVSFSVVSKPSLWTGPPPRHWILRVKRSGSEAYRFPPSSSEVENTWIYTCTSPYVFMASCVIKRRGNCACTSF
jgi:hypothetical protein